MPKEVNVTLFMAIVIALGTIVRWEIRRILARRRTDGW
jgi:hypothetical protein